MNPTEKRIPAFALEWQATFNAVRDAICLLDNNQRIVRVNRAMEDLFGKKESALLGRPCWEVVHGTVTPLPECPVILMQQSRQRESLEFLLDGRWFDITVDPLLDANGVLVGAVHILRDNTKRKRAEEALQKIEERFRVAFHISPDAVNINRLEDGLYVDINEGFTALTGYTPEEVLGKTSLEINIWEDPQDRKKLVAGLRKNGRVDNQEARFRMKDGRVLTGLMSAKVLMLEDLPHILSVTKDMEGLKEAEEGLRRRALELAAINALGRQVSLTLSLDQVITEALKEMTRAVQPDLAFFFIREGARLLLKGIHPDDASIGLGEIEHRVGQCLCGLAVSQGQALYSRDIFIDPRCTWEECKQAGLRSFAALPLPSGDSFIGVIGLASREERDFEEQSEFLETLLSQVAIGITNARLHEQVQRHAAELEQRVAKRTAELECQTEELEKANLRLLEVDRLKSLFIASMSHELRTPLNSIIGFTGIILQGLTGAISGEQRKQLSLVKESARHLLSLINDIIDLSKIEAGKVEVEWKVWDLPALVREVMESLAVIAAPKGLRLSADQPESLVVKSDRRRVKQVLVNLLGNAVKFTEQGEIEIRVTPKDRTVEVSVRDTGPGIRAEDQEQLFKPFSQITREDRFRQAGTGLGLYLSQKIAILLGGKIRVESVMRKGSTFTLSLPKGGHLK